MEIVWALLVGLVVGALAKLLMPGRDPGGILTTMALGVAGSFVALIVGRLMGVYRAHEQGPGIIASALGAIVILALYRTFRGRRQQP